MTRTPDSPGPTFTRPLRQIVTMLVIVGVVAFGLWFAWNVIYPLFLTNTLLNGAIVAVFVIGVLATFWQVAQVYASVGWIEGFLGRHPGAGDRRAPTLLAPLAALLANRAARMQISAGSQRSILDSVAQRMDEARDITRYLGNLLIFLGLLGTFFGLATSVPAMVETIRNLAPQEGESGVQVFAKLMTGLEAQLGGMGTAFSSSLLGLAGSLVVGLLDLFAGHGQNRFYRELEDWLSTITRVGLVGGDEGSEEEKILVQLFDALAVQLQDQAAAVREVLADHAAGREQLADQVTRLAQSFDRIARRLEGEAGQSAILTRLLAAQEATYAQVEAQTQATADLARALTAPEGGTHADAESRMRLRSIDVQLLRILEEISAGRQETTADLRADIAALTAAIRQAGRGAGVTAKG